MLTRLKMKAWRTFGLTQLLIRRKYRKTPRPGIIPTFKEFVQYLVGELSPSPNSMKRSEGSSGAGGRAAHCRTRG